MDYKSVRLFSNSPAAHTPPWQKTATGHFPLFCAAFSGTYISSKLRPFSPYLLDSRRLRQQGVLCKS